MALLVSLLLLGEVGIGEEALEGSQFFDSMHSDSLQEREVQQWPKDTVIFLVWGWGSWAPQRAVLEPDILIGLGAGSEILQEGLRGVTAEVVPWPWACGAAQHLPIEDLVTGAGQGLGLGGSCSRVSLEHIGLDWGREAAGL